MSLISAGSISLDSTFKNYIFCANIFIRNTEHLASHAVSDCEEKVLGTYFRKGEMYKRRLQQAAMLRRCIRV